MTGLTWRRRATLAATATVAALALAACGGTEPPPATPTTSAGSGQLGGAASTTPTLPSTTPSPAGSNGGGGGGSNTPTYPSKAGDYAVAFMKAWSAKDYTRVGQLGIQSMVQQVKDNVNANGAPNSQWTMYSCSSVQNDNTQGCTVRNAHGDDARVTLNAGQLGAPVAVTSAVLDRTIYPSNPGNYVDEVLRAKDNDNKQRVARLGNSTTFSKLTCYISGKDISAAPTSDPNYVKVTVQGLGVDIGKELTFKVLTNPGGKANAVKDALVVACP